MKRLLLFGVAVAAVVLLLATFGSGYTGTDQQAVSAVQERAPEYDPWASPAWAPGATTEAALFALQGASARRCSATTSTDSGRAMHRTLEAVQVDATPAVEGPLRVYFVLAALLLTATTTRTSVYAVAIVTFAALSTHAVGRAYVSLLRYPVSFLLPSLLLIAFLTPGIPRSNSGRWTSPNAAFGPRPPPDCER
ncbi:energy-coupling factor ABC transporter substrate-binding protein [Haloplanus sp. GCM10025708]|uniref:energy-coupling factor ABC transporter substrate-binding protein n=1 Tax=Haloplanus sp. GCM10025708 TaxID=3252679 RepID=UPI003622BC53